MASSTEQQILTALTAAKEHFGRNWKSKLIMDCWPRSAYPSALAEHSGMLQKIRNSWGPSKLQRFQFPKQLKEVCQQVDRDCDEVANTKACDILSDVLHLICSKTTLQQVVRDLDSLQDHRYQQRLSDSQWALLHQFQASLEEGF